MKKGLLFLLLLCLTINIEAQSNPLSLPLGIDVSGVGTGVVREHSTNADANRFMEKTIKEDPDNLEKIEKLLNAGASAFVSYEMIDKKQYKLMDLMYKKNPKLIRYSQMLHYACALVRLMIDKGANVNITDEIVSVFVCPRNNSASFNSPIFAAMKYHNMMDIVKLLRTKGAPLKVQYKNYCEIKWKDIEGEAILDEYKEAILLGEL